MLWKKFLNASKAYSAKVLVMGGDITGKMVIPIVQGERGQWTATFHGRNERMQTEADVGTAVDPPEVVRAPRLHRLRQAESGENLEIPPPHGLRRRHIDQPRG